MNIGKGNHRTDGTLGYYKNSIHNLIISVVLV